MKYGSLNTGFDISYISDLLIFCIYQIYPPHFFALEKNAAIIFAVTVFPNLRGLVMQI